MAKSFNAQMADRFAKITNDYGKVNQYVHETAMLIVGHAKEHGDCSTAQGLVMAMPASIRREMLILWFRKFTPIVVKNDDKWVAKMHPKESKLFVEWDLEAAEKTPFFALAEQNKEREPLDLEGLINLVARVAKQIETKIEKGEIVPEEIATAEALAAQIKRIKVKHVAAAPANDGDNGPAASDKELEAA